MGTVKGVHKDYFKLRENVGIAGTARTMLSKTMFREPLAEHPPITYASAAGGIRETGFWNVFSKTIPNSGEVYVPTALPIFSKKTINNTAEREYDELSFIILDQFLKGYISNDEFMKLLRGFEEIYRFDVPLEKSGPNNWIMWLSKGPTAAFKDFAALMLKCILWHYAETTGKELTFVVATSGDTGGAIAQAFHGVEGVKLVVLFPKDGVTERQRKYMTTLGGNVTALAVKGPFNDCIKIVAKVFVDKDLAGINPMAANSLNYARIIAQIVYYFHAYSFLLKAGAIGEGERVIFSTPTGNAGSACAGMYAWMMGLPIGRGIAATNANDTVPRFFKTGKYEPRETVYTLSNAMDIPDPANFPRMIYGYGGYMGSSRIIKMPNMDALRRDYYSTSIIDGETAKTIVRIYKEHGILLEPHGAVAYAALERYRAESRDSTAGVVIETADPAKFPVEMEKIMRDAGVRGFEPPILDSMKKMAGLPEYYSEIAPDYEAVKRILLGLKK